VAISTPRKEHWLGEYDPGLNRSALKESHDLKLAPSAMTPHRKLRATRKCLLAVRVTVL